MEEHFTKTVIPFERLDETFRSKDIHVLLFSLKLPASNASWSKYYYLQSDSSRFNLIWYTGNTDHVYLKMVSVLMSKFYGTWAAWQNKSSIVKWMDSIRLFAFYKEIIRVHFVTMVYWVSEGYSITYCYMNTHSQTVLYFDRVLKCGWLMLNWVSNIDAAHGDYVHNGDPTCC